MLAFNNHSYSIRHLGDLVKQEVSDVIVTYENQAEDRRNYRVSFAKTRAERSRSVRKHLGFTPRYTVADGVLEIKAAIEDGRIRDYRDAHYSNYKTLSEEGNAHLIRHTRMTPLYADGLEEAGPSATPVSGLAGMT